MVVTETKIDATHRLQKDGRWEEASEFRVEQRQKFRAEGLTKKEANEKAWDAMILKFPPPDEEGYIHFLAMSEFPPYCIDLKQSSFFFVYCRVRAILHHCCPTEMAKLNGPMDDRIRVEPKANVEPPPASLNYVERTNALLKFGFEHPVDFLKHCSEVFLEAVDEIPDEAPAAEESRLELRAYVETLPTLKKIIEQRFTGALCP